MKLVKNDYNPRENLSDFLSLETKVKDVSLTNCHFGSLVSVDDDLSLDRESFDWKNRIFKTAAVSHLI